MKVAHMTPLMWMWTERWSFESGMCTTVFASTLRSLSTMASRFTPSMPHRRTKRANGEIIWAPAMLAADSCGMGASERT